MNQTESFTNSESLAPWKRGEVPAHWPDFAADRDPANSEAPPMLHSELHLAFPTSNELADRLTLEDSPFSELADRLALEDAASSELADTHRLGLEDGRLADNNRFALEDSGLRSPPSSELANNNRLALEAFKALDALDGTSDDELDEEELSEEDLIEDSGATVDYIPALIDRTSGTFTRVVSKVAIPFIAIVILVIAMGGTWSTADATPAAAVVTAPAATHAAEDADHPRAKSSHKDLSGKLNLNTASEDQLMMLPTVGPSKADRIVAWRKKNGGFKRTADLRHVKGFGYKTFKKLEPFIDVKGDTTLVAK